MKRNQLDKKPEDCAIRTGGGGNVRRSTINVNPESAIRTGGGGNVINATSNAPTANMRQLKTPKAKSKGAGGTF